ncbi:MAG: 3',5'-cyclic-AMP phosphodiesterase [Vibrio sp.]
MSDCLKLVQITDTHLFESPQDELLGVNTLNSFHAVLEQVQAKHADMDALLMTGDVSQDHTQASYLRFEEAITALDIDAPCYWLPGNHDDQSFMFPSLLDSRICQDKLVQLNDAWQAILLDSQVRGVPHGVLCDEQLAFLEQSLTEQPDKFSFILLHHHPLLAQSDWLDNHCLKNSQALWQLLSRFPNAKIMVCGHIHQEMNILHQGVTVMSTPSTCVQFKPNSNDFAVDHLSPGWRTFNLYPDGRFESKVERLPQGQFMPDLGSTGY